MLSLEQIAFIVKSRASIIKEAKEKKQPIEFNAIYSKAVDQANRISIHAEQGLFPSALFAKRAPNQTDAEFDYIRANYKTKTFPIWSRFISNLGRIWNDNNWDISYPENAKGDNSIYEYVNFNYPNFDNYDNYFKNIVSVTKERDPNAVIVIKPLDIPVLQDSEGNFYVDNTVLIEPICDIYNSENVIDYVENRYFVGLSDEKSEVRVNDRIEYTGLIFDIYDSNAIYKAIQKGDKDDLDFEIVVYYQHDLGYVPAQKLKGIPKVVKKNIYYESFFLPAVDLLDSVLLDESNLTAIKAAHAFPHKWEYVDECDYTDELGASCYNGKVWKDNHQVNCPKCGGSGKKRPGVLGVHQIMMPKKTDDTTKGIQLPPFGWEAPDTQIMDFLRNEIDKNTNGALSILGLTSTTEAQGSDTALGKLVDREELFSLLQMMSNQIFSLYEFCLQAIIDMRYNDSSLYPSISYPQNFAIRNEVELTQELTNARQTNMPEIAYRQLLQEYLNKRFSNSETSQKAVDLAFYADRLIMLTSIEVAQKKLSGSIANWEDILHTSIYQFMREAVNDNSEFFNLSIDEQKNILVEMAKAKDKEINPQTTVDSIMNRLGNGNA